MAKLANSDRRRSSDGGYPPIESAGYLVRDAHRAFQKLLEKRIAAHGISRGQWYFLRVLWTEDGLLSQAGEKVFFDRSTLYALRGAFAAGKTERALDLLKQYTNRRLLGDHVPYPIEWGPEGTQPHLAAESALYCRVFTEGVFGIRPTGFQSFEVTPALPKAWDRMQLKNIHAFGSVFDLAVTRAGDKLQLETVVSGRGASRVVDSGATVRINFDARQ